MAWRQSGSGRDVDSQRRGAPPEQAGDELRPVELAPPGSAERSRSDLTGFNMDREERPEAREGRFHRAASLRLLSDVISDERHPLQGRAGELERWGGGWHGEQPWESSGSQRAPALNRGGGELQGGFEQDFVANELTRESFATSFAARERTMRMAAQERGLVDQYRQHQRGGQAGGRGSAGEGHTFTPGARGLREEGSVSRRWAREPLTAAEIMTRNPRTLMRDSPLSEAARLMRDENVGVIPVVDGEGRLVGLLTDRDMVVRAFTEQRSPQHFRVGEVMTEDVSAVTPDTSILEVTQLMGREQVRRAPVVDRDDRLLGIIALADIANRAEQDEELQRALERISARRSFWSRL